MPFGDGDTQAREPLSMFKDQEAITLRLEEGEKVWCWLLDKVGGGFGDGFH